MLLLQYEPNFFELCLRFQNVPVPPAAFAMSLLPPRGGPQFAPTALRHLMREGSPIAQLYGICSKCIHLQGVSKAAHESLAMVGTSHLLLCLFWQHNLPADVEVLSLSMCRSLLGAQDLLGSWRQGSKAGFSLRGFCISLLIMWKLFMCLNQVVSSWMGC